MRLGMIRTILLLAILSLLAGCGGGGGNNAPASPIGTAVFTLEWPAGKAPIPDEAQSIRIEISQGTTLLKSRIYDRPPDGGTVKATFYKLPVGQVNYTALAFSLPQAQGTLAGKASGSIDIKSGLSTTLRMSLQATDTVAKITVSGPTDPIHVHDTITLTATATNAFDEVIVADLTWTSSNVGDATVNDNGEVTGVSPGSATITAKDSTSGKSGSVKITVQRDPTDVTVTIAPANPTVQEHGTVKLTATAKDPSGEIVTANYSWQSQNTGVATVDETGNVTGVSQGNTTITAGDSISGKSGSVTLTVSRDISDVTVTISPAHPTVQELSTIRLTATAITTKKRNS